MAYVWLEPDNRCIKIEPADLKTEQRDIVLMLTTLADLSRPDAARSDSATYARLARLLVPYVTGATVEQLATSFELDIETFKSTLRRVLLYFLYSERSE